MMRTAVVAAFFVCATFVQCHGAGGREVPADSTKPEGDATSDAGAPNASAQVGPAIWVVLDDARFADARALEDDAHHLEAAAALEADLTRTTNTKERCGVRYAIGHLRALGADDPGAAKAFDEASADNGVPCVLASYARGRAAAAYERAGKADDAIARAVLVDAHTSIAEEAALVRAEALAARGDRAQALPIWREHLTKHPRGLRWVDTATRLAAALLDGIDGDAKAHAQEAFDLATRVMIEAPAFSNAGDESTGASGLRKRAGALDASLAHDLSIDEHIKRARAFIDASQTEKGRVESEVAIAAIAPKDHVSELGCRASTVRAQAIAKSSKRGQAADAWGDAIRSCAKETDLLASALFSGAKASAGQQRLDEALERYARVEKEWPKSRLADDARLAGALIVRDRGDVARFETMLLALPDDYPEGDMRGEALFRVALERMARGDWEGARAPLDRNEQIDAAGRHWATAGRASYFRAKCAAKMGDAADAKRRWLDVIRLHPLAYYMAQSYGRLAEVDAALAHTTVDGLMAAEPTGSFLTREHPEMQSTEFLRALSLLEVGETEYARKEFTTSGVLADGADTEMVWVVASLFDRAGAADVGHGFARGRLSDHLAHYPSGKWRFAWEAAYPRAFAPIVTHASGEERVPAPVIWGVMREESAFIADVRSPSNAHGLMQLLPSTARELARGTGWASDETALHQPRVSVALGTRLLAQLRSSFGDNPSLAIASYNAGAGAVRVWLHARPTTDYDVWVEQIPFEETRGYLKRVLSSELAYAMLYVPETAKEVLELPIHAQTKAP